MSGVSILVIQCCGCGTVLGATDGQGKTGVTSTLCEPCIEERYPEHIEDFRALRSAA